MKTEYSNVKIPVNTVGVPATTTALSTRSGTRLTRVTEDGRDDLVIQRDGKPDIHVAWAQVRGGIVAEPTYEGLSKMDAVFAEEKAAAEAEEQDRLDAIAAAGGPKNDAVRVTKRKKTT